MALPNVTVADEFGRARAVQGVKFDNTRADASSDRYARVQATLRDAETAARDAADKARNASAYAALWPFISLLIGAFAASLAATYGGRQRDI